ncbi:MAG TPA: hypothetical protein VN944_12280 [Nitrospiria bacterium]|nr:hypothetical protein [Nitrospiria bacterium]
MNISETLEKAILFQEKAFQFYQAEAKTKEALKRPDLSTQLKEIASQKSRLTGLLRKSFQESNTLPSGVSRVNLVSDREMDEGLAFLTKALALTKDNTVPPAKTLDMIRQITSYEATLIYAPLSKMYDLRMLKTDTGWILALSRYFHALTLYLKKNRGPGLETILEKLPFLNKKVTEVRSYSEKELLKSLIQEKKPVTLTLKGGKTFSGQIIEADYFSFRCLGEENSGKTSREQLFLKDSVISVRVNA